MLLSMYYKSHVSDVSAATPNFEVVAKRRKQWSAYSGAVLHVIGSIYS